MTGPAQRRFQPVNPQFEADMKRYESDRKRYRGIRACEANCSFTVYADQKYKGSRKSLDDAVQLLSEVMQ